MLIPARPIQLAQRDTGARQDPLPVTASQAEAAIQATLSRFAHEMHGEPVRAQAQQIIHIFVENGQSEKAANVALQFADCCRRARFYFDALSFYRQALERKSLSRQSKAAVLNGIALVYADVRASDLAARYFAQSLAEAQDDVSTRTIALTGLADLYRQQGALDKASAYIGKAVLLRNRYHAAPDPALLYEQGLVSQEQKRIEAAKTTFAQALAIYAANADALGQVRVLCALSSLSLATSQKQAALKYSLQAREVAKQIRPGLDTSGDYLDFFEMQWQSLINHARAERDLGHIDSALSSYSSTLDYISGSWLIALSTEPGAIAFRERTKEAYLEYVDLLIRQGRLQEAYEVACFIKALTFLSFAGKHKPKPRPEDRERVDEIQKLSLLANSLRSQLASGLPQIQRSRVQAELQRAEYDAEEIRLQSEMLHVQDRQGPIQRPDTEKLRQRTAADQTAVLEFSLEENRSLVALFTRGRAYFETLPSRHEIESAVKPFLDELGTAPNSLTSERDLHKLLEKSRQIYAMLLGPMLNRIEPGQKLIIVRDGLLHYLPFDALLNNGRYLIEDYEISYANSASLLIQPQDQLPSAGNKMELLAFGDPDFGSDMESSKSNFRKIAVDVLRGGVASRGFQLPPLPRTRDEVQGIASFFPADRTRVYLGKHSTEEALRQESLHNYRRLHFATHSLVDEKSPDRSAVVLTPGSVEDGLLDVREISELDLDCDLVVLSACQTGRGQLLTGEGIVGLARAFLYAGAREVVVSLWSVTDISTGRLMKDFYRQMAGNARTAAALRQAKLQMLRSGPETPHPYYWAPFISIGKGN